MMSAQLDIFWRSQLFTKKLFLNSALPDQPCTSQTNKETPCKKVSLVVRNEKIILLYFSIDTEYVKENKESPIVMVPMKTNSYIPAIQSELKLPVKEWLLKTLLSQNRRVYWYLIYFEISLDFIESSFFITVNEVKFHFDK